MCVLWNWGNFIDLLDGEIFFEDDIIWLRGCFYDSSIGGVSLNCDGFFMFWVEEI